MDALTLSDDQRWVEQKVPHQLSSELVEKTAGNCPVKY